MSKTGKIILGIISLIPLLLLIAYIAFFIGLFTSVFRESIQQSSGRPPEFMMGNVGVLMAIVPGLIVSSLGLLIYYIIHIMNNTRLNSMEQLVWVIIILFANMIGYPIYWYMQIWKAPAATGHQS